MTRYLDNPRDAVDHAGTIARLDSDKNPRSPLIDVLYHREGEDDFTVEMVHAADSDTWTATRDEFLRAFGEEPDGGADFRRTVASFRRSVEHDIAHLRNHEAHEAMHAPTELCRTTEVPGGDTVAGYVASLDDEQLAQLSEHLLGEPEEGEDAPTREQVATELAERIDLSLDDDDLVEDEDIAFLIERFGHAVVGHRFVGVDCEYVQLMDDERATDRMREGCYGDTVYRKVGGDWSDEIFGKLVFAGGGPAMELVRDFSGTRMRVGWWFVTTEVDDIDGLDELVDFFLGWYAEL